jgi:exopolysaccharide production protein ExoY
MPKEFLGSESVQPAIGWSYPTDSRWIDPEPWKFSRSIPIYRITSKRVFDIFMSAGLILFFCPLMVMIAAVLIFEGGTCVFAHERVGVGGTRFRCLKFRTMVRDSEVKLAEYLNRNPALREEWNRSWKLKNDPRVTALGRFLRRSSLDELPQLFNVLSGDMSLIGPRPITAREISRYARRFHDYCRCRPGLTGLWQVYRDDDVDYLRRTELDSLYVAHWSFRRDLIILAMTVPTVLSRRGAC